MAMLEVKDRPLKLAVLTVSDTRTAETDKGGSRVVRLAMEEGHEIVDRDVVKDDAVAIAKVIERWKAMDDLDVGIITGGTGIAKKDVTIEAVQPFLNKTISGFGELFRYLSYTVDIGSKAMASRAIAGVSDDLLLFAIPGSLGAVSLAMTKLILPEIRHLVYELEK